MAAKRNETDQANSHENQSNSNENGFEDFITTQLQQQQKASRETDNVDSDKRDAFIARAQAESQRMNREVQKAQEKRDKLYAEFGEASFSAWRNEHAAAVLTPQQANLVEESYKQ